MDPAGIECLVLSHHHFDHVGGLPALIEAGARPTIYALEDFPDALLASDDMVLVDSAMEVRSGIRTTGPPGAGRNRELEK